MANKKASGKKSSASNAQSAKSDNTVVRIKAGSSAPKKQKKAVEAEVVETTAPAKAPKVKKEKKQRKNIFTAIGGYFKGAWVELRQVRWPTRSATWSLTGAVLLYTLFFVVLILLLDAAFKFLFEIILGK